MNTSTWADNTGLAAAINDGHLPSPELVRDLVNAAYDRFKPTDDGTVWEAQALHPPTPIPILGIGELVQEGRRGTCPTLGILPFRSSEVISASDCYGLATFTQGMTLLEIGLLC
jgi:hypothetical protein